ncbi:hypothetical protein Z517_00038 [Fonsecaea pedrosoi CBS 271.37]|uniref:Very long-chain fatty acid transport protein n=1 Tax=Fonsecaea pedrosoi CBS 271.37 TaxID=1442368 RepID=A0A0D2H195_9EURO|nr:uncharacterized protein Z517_00038 [Fonsecaea pedrosoi CBS 271.37]KIW84650.1 hypothetical protein Z517_00038 [Fonsecaea pedrosoi CBS 271.37]
MAAVVAGSLAAAAYLDARYLIRHDLSSDSPARARQRSLQFISKRFRQGKPLVYHLIEDHALGPNADNLFLIFEDRAFSYKQFFHDIQRVANWLMKDLGIKRHEIVALDGENSPEYLLIWFGLEAIGACPSFINYNLTAAALVHCVKLCDARFLLAARTQLKLVQPCEEELGSHGTQTIYYDTEFISSLQESTAIPSERWQGLKPEDLSSLIYTSGTTGMPKGTIKQRGREINVARTIAQYLKLEPRNRMYTALPLYHGAAHGLCVTPSIFAGSTVVLSRKFSHKTFWPEVRKSRADTIQYVGEVCRYLINAPANPLDKQHCVTRAWGNGMRPDVWEPFRQRFGIETINELYASTDSLGLSFNANRGEFGRNAVGIRGLCWRWMNNDAEKRVKIDVTTEELLLDKNGFAIECKTGEAGEAIHRLDPANPEAAFPGYYKNSQATEKKKIKDVFKRGDLWLRSGDLMRQDSEGRLYFVDRLGDTFRWKSENVSTNEVGDVLGAFDQVAEISVYGIQVPNADGRAGCAAILPAAGVSVSTFDFAGLTKHAISALPRYAVPLFLRFVSQLDYTGTMKVQKGRLRAEGMDPDKVSHLDRQSADVIYWLPPGATQYVPFTQENWRSLKAGRVRL